MLAPHIKRNVDKLWNLFWSAGITNPLVAVEQITYLLFLKRLEAIDHERVSKGSPSIYKGTEVQDGKEVEVDYSQCRWSYIEQDKTPQHLIDVVFPWLRNLEKHLAAGQTSENEAELSQDDGDEAPKDGINVIGNRMSDAYFQLDPNKGAILQQAIDLINQLFAHVDDQSSSTDVMGDTFEYLLSEIATAGKNGQFRTPRHIIRCMVEMLDPQPGERIIDPAAGTAGFLFSSLTHLLAKHTTPELLRVEWDGTVHRAAGDQLAATPDVYAAVFDGKHYVGFDNDRTMVRIGWMNMILHGIENPQIHQRDSLGKRRDDDSVKGLLESEQYDVVLANPPFTGKVDTADLDITTFPKAGKSGKKATQVVTNKSELLFVWRMLDLLAVGGRCAVIVPEGVLFGNTEGHVRLRRELLTEHRVEAVISLPAGVFQPYTGVKTSILVFQKETPKDERHRWKPVDQPRTHEVWFYEVEEEAYSLDAKRNERRGQDNDLWDMLEKYQHRHDPEYEELDYFQPDYWTERWRMVDNKTLRVFSDDQEVVNWKDRVAAIHELFAELPRDPEEAYEQIHDEQQPKLEAFAQAIVSKVVSEELNKSKSSKSTNLETAIDKALKKATADFRRMCESHKELFDTEEKVAYQLYQKDYREALDGIVEILQEHFLSDESIEAKDFDEAKVLEEIDGIARQYARLDGYDVMLRSLECIKHQAKLKEAKHWVAPVRVYAEDSDWENEDKNLKGSHDEVGNPRLEYQAFIQLYDDKDNLQDGLLDPECIEAKDWDLSANQYKPIYLKEITNDKTFADILHEIKAQEIEISQGLDRLFAMVEGKE
jgi:type I restriction enzyme M protein